MIGVKVGKIFDIPVYLTYDFMFFFLFMFALGNFVGCVFMMFVFLAILAHELGHIYAAQFYGVKAECITLSMMGGLANLSDIPKNPLAEMIITIAGPMVNIVLATMLLPLLINIKFTSDSLLLNFYFTNFAIAVMNMIPCLPLDGGRCFRSFLTLITGNHFFATQIAVATSVVLMIPLFFASIYFYHFIGTIICVFVITSALSEYAFEKRKRLEKLP